MKTRAGGETEMRVALQRATSPANCFGSASIESLSLKRFCVRGTYVSPPGLITSLRSTCLLLLARSIDPSDNFGDSKGGSCLPRFPNGINTLSSDLLRLAIKLRNWLSRVSIRIVIWLTGGSNVRRLEIK